MNHEFTPIGERYGLETPIETIPAGEARQVLLSQLVSDVYQEAAPPLRAKLLECLIRPLPPLGLVAVAAGAFGAFLHREHWGQVSVSIDDALHFSAQQIFELAKFVDQFEPEALHQITTLMTENPSYPMTLSGSLLLLALGLWLPKRGERRKATPAAPG